MLFLNRLAGVALALSLVAAATVPTIAGPADVALLQKYAGSYKGDGKLSGKDAGSISCRMTMKPNGSKLSYTGRCSIDGASNGFSGSFSYNDKAGRYEASSSQGSLPGKKVGSSIVFNMKSQNTTRGSASSVMTLSGGTIKIDFKLTDKKTNDVTTGHVPFART